MSVEEDKQQEMLNEHARQLGEHFDSVQIFASRHESGIHGATLNFAAGEGNFYAAVGQVRLWLVMREEEARVDVRQRRAAEQNEEEE